MYSLRSARFDIARLRPLLPVLCLAGWSIAAPPAAHAGTTYSDLTSFTAAAGGQTLVTFEQTDTPDGEIKTYAGGYTVTTGNNGSVTFNTYNPAGFGSVGNTYNNYNGGTSNVQSASGQQTSFLVSRQYSEYASQNPNKNETIFNGRITFATGQKSFGTLYGDYGYSFRSLNGHQAYAKDAQLDTPWRVDFFSGGASGTLIGSTNIAANYTPDTPAFLGFTSDQSFDTVVFTGLTGANEGSISYLFLDDVRYSTSTADIVVPPAAVPEPGATLTGLVMAGTMGLGLVRGRIRSRKAS